MKLNRNNHIGRLLTCLALVMVMAFPRLFTKACPDELGEIYS